MTDYDAGIEAAAKVADDWGWSNKPDHAHGIRDAIRSLLGTKPTAGERLPYDVLLRERDEFIVQKGLWDDFCEWLKVNDKLPPVTAGERGSIVAWLNGIADNYADIDTRTSEDHRFLARAIERGDHLPSRDGG